MSTAPFVTRFPQLLNSEATGLVEGEAVYSLAPAAVKRALATATATSTTTVGLVSESIAPGVVGHVVVMGPLEMSTGKWDALTGDVGGLVTGAFYYVSAAAAGKITKTAPAVGGQFVVPVGRAVSPTILIVSPASSVPAGTGVITGALTNNTIPIATGPNSLGDSLITYNGAIFSAARGLAITGALSATADSEFGGSLTVDSGQIIKVKLAVGTALNAQAPLHVSADGTVVAGALLPFTPLELLSGGANGNIVLAVTGSANASAALALAGIKARGTTSAPTAALNGDGSCTLTGFIYDGATCQQTATINMAADGAVSAGVAPQKISFRTGATTGAAATERMKIDSAGLVTISGGAIVLGTAKHSSGAVVPNGNVIGSIGDTYSNTAGGGVLNTFWVKTSGAGTNAGWVGVA